MPILTRRAGANHTPDGRGNRVTGRNTTVNHGETPRENGFRTALRPFRYGEGEFANG